MGNLCHLCLWDNTWWLGSIIYSGFKASASRKKINNIVIRERIRKVGKYSSLVYEEDNASLGSIDQVENGPLRCKKTPF
jgi:hypothetical protein